MENGQSIGAVGIDEVYKYLDVKSEPPYTAERNYHKVTQKGKIGVVNLS